MHRGNRKPIDAWVGNPCYSWGMRCRLILLLIPMIPVSLIAATTRPATTQSLEEQLAQHKAQEQREYLSQIQAAPELMLPTGTISDIFEPSIEKEMIVVRPKLAGTDGQMRCTVKGLTGPCTVAIFAEHNAPDGGINALQFAHRDFSNSQEIFRHTMLFAHARVRSSYRWIWTGWCKAKAPR